jgi:hypothetical protein
VEAFGVRVGTGADGRARSSEGMDTGARVAAAAELEVAKSVRVEERERERARATQLDK